MLLPEKKIKKDSWTPPSKKKRLYKPGFFYSKSKEMNSKHMHVDVQQVVAGHFFTGDLHVSTTLRVPSMHPGGMWTTLCNVPAEMATLAQVSRKFREGCLAWRKKEMEKMVGVMLKHALERAFDLCDRDCYPYHGSPPEVSNMEHVLCLQRHEVVAVKFRRTGVRRSHKLHAWMEVEDWYGVSFVTNKWTAKTPRSGWKMMSKMRGKEIDEWKKWMHCERRSMNWWFRDIWGGVGCLPANTDLPATMYACSCRKVSCLCRLSAH